MCICVCAVYVCICMYVCSMYVCMRVCTYARVCVFIRASIYAHAFIHAHVRIRLYAYTSEHVCILLCISVHECDAMPLCQTIPVNAPVVKVANYQRSGPMTVDGNQGVCNECGWKSRCVQ